MNEHPETENSAAPLSPLPFRNVTDQADAGETWALYVLVSMCSLPTVALLAVMMTSMVAPAILAMR